MSSAGPARPEARIGCLVRGRAAPLPGEDRRKQLTDAAGFCGDLQRPLPFLPKVVLWVRQRRQPGQNRKGCHETPPLDREVPDRWPPAACGPEANVESTVPLISAERGPPPLVRKTTVSWR